METNPSQSEDTLSPVSANGSVVPTVPDHGTTYYKGYWGAYKGHVRGILRGLVVGSVMGAIVGGAMLAAGAAGMFALTTTALPLMCGFTVVGAVLGAEVFGKIGNTAGNIASQYAETEMRLRYPSLPEVSATSPAPGFGHHFEVPPDKDGKIFHWRVAIPGMVLGTSLGALFAASGLGAELISELGVEAVQHAAGHAALTAAATETAITSTVVGAGTLLGASYGVNRGLFKSLFNFTDGLLQGKVGGPSADDIARDQEKFKIKDPTEPYVITSTERDEEYHRLLNGYYKTAFAAGFSGNSRGLLNGIMAGTLTGLVGGLAVAAALPASAAFLSVTVIAFSTALGGKLGMNIFSDSGRESAALAKAREVYVERIKSLKGGNDIAFGEAEKRACIRTTLHPDLAPPEVNEEKWINGKLATIGLVVGAGIGAALAPISAPFLGLLAGKTAALATPIALSTAAFGATGASFGIGGKPMKSMLKLADKFFMGTFFPDHDFTHWLAKQTYPAIAPDSPLNPAEKSPEKSPEKTSEKTSEQSVLSAEIQAEPSQPVPEYLRKILEQARDKKQEPEKPLAKRFIRNIPESEYPQTESGFSTQPLAGQAR
jgi:hypothetical protein